MTFADARERAGLSKLEAAHAAQTTPRVVHLLEDGRGANVNLVDATRLLDALGVSDADEREQCIYAAITSDILSYVREDR